MSRMTDGTGQRPGSSRAPRPAGSARGTLPGRPPPVMWASPWSSWPARLEVVAQAQDRPGVDPGRGEQHVAERGVAGRIVGPPARVPAPRTRRRSAAYGASRPQPASATTDRTSENPFACSPDAARPTIASPARTADPSSSRDRSTTPVHAPARSTSSGRHRPRVLGRLAADQGAAGEPAAGGDPADDRGHALRVEPADGHVVEEEERLGAGADDVVGAHRDEVDAEARRSGPSPGRSPSSCPPRRSRRRGAARGSRPGSRSTPPNPPSPPTTSGRRVEATAARISSTARSPASTSTPARV